MNKTLTIGQRILADTPIFFKIAQICAFAAILADALLVKLNIGSADIHTMLGTAGFVVMTVSQFATKDVQTLEAAPDIVTGFENLLPQLMEQFGQVKTAIGNIPPPPPIPDAIANLANAIANKPPAAVDVNITNQPPADNQPQAADAAQQASDNVIKMPNTDL